MQPQQGSSLKITGLALIILPLVAMGLKMFSFGWMMVMLMFGPVFVLVIGYVLQIMIAAQGFLSRKALFAEGPARKRATAAAWLTSVAVVLVGVFMPDGGDIGYGSTLQVWLGAYSGDYEVVESLHQATDRLTEVATWIAGLVWVVAFLWLVVEWMAALVRRGRARRASSV
ncbi:MAG: hypothetical protein AB7V10_04475 [Leucobacter sp.]|jgi:hypothetical protein